MIAVDTSSLVCFFEGESGSDVDLIESALQASSLFLPPPVLTEILSEPELPEPIRKLLLQFPVLSITEGFWKRAGDLRAAVLASGRKARLADSLIAQMVIDHDLPLITRDNDFKAFAKVSKLKLIH